MKYFYIQEALAAAEMLSSVGEDIALWENISIIK